MENLINPLDPLHYCILFICIIYITIKIVKILIHFEHKDFSTLDTIIGLISVTCTFYVVYNHSVYGF